MPNRGSGSGSTSTVDNVVHALIAVAMGMAAERVAGTGLALGVAMAIGFVLSALAAKTRGMARACRRP